MAEDNEFMIYGEDAGVESETRILVPVHDTVIFPGITYEIEAQGAEATGGVLSALESEGRAVFACQRKSSSEGGTGICKIGVLAKIEHIEQVSDNNARSKKLRLRVTGLYRVAITEVVTTEQYFSAQVSLYADEDSDSESISEIRESIKDTFIRLTRSVPPRVLKKYIDATRSVDVDDFIYRLSDILFVTSEGKQSILAKRSRTEQLEWLAYESIAFVRKCELKQRVEARTLEILRDIDEKRRPDRRRVDEEVDELKSEIMSKVRQRMDKNQREFILREQLKVIHEELGDEDDEAAMYEARLDSCPLPDYAVSKVKKELTKLRKMSPTSPEAAVSRGYLELIFDLPWGKFTDSRINLTSAKKILDEDHYGLEKIKERIVEFLAVQELKRNTNAPVLCFVGPPGVGKTSIVTSIARAAGRPFVQMSLGGVRDESEIRGHRRTYIGSLPGRILSGLREAGANDPVFLLDEIDKMTSDFRGDPSSALLEVLDSNQNFKFRDHFLEMPYDLSKVIFITTANTVESIAPPLLDRMEVIELTGYTFNEKLQIAKKYLIPKQCEANGMPPSKIKFTDEAIIRIIVRYTRESGVRNLERKIGTVIRKQAVKFLNGKLSKTAQTIDESSVIKYLGKERFTESTNTTENEIGKATGLAWTAVGGTTLDIEVALIKDGKGGIKITGNLGDVMKESVQAAVSYLQSNVQKYGIDIAKFTDYSIHVHFPEGAIPKDGPSAGITVATAILSALSERKVRSEVTMTGEITLRGNVLPIGGLKEKSLAAMRYGKKRMLIPKDNEKDLDDIPSEVKSSVEIILVDNVDSVFDAALI